MKKFRQIAALIGIILLVVMYIVTIIFALTDDPKTMNLLAASLAATFIIPVTLWVIGIFWRIRPRDPSSLSSNDIDSKTKEDEEDGNDKSPE